MVLSHPLRLVPRFEDADALLGFFALLHPVGGAEATEALRHALELGFSNPCLCASHASLALRESGAHLALHRGAKQDDGSVVLVGPKGPTASKPWDVPVIVTVPAGYPLSPPAVRLDLDPRFTVAPGHAHVDQFGGCRLPCLETWGHEDHHRHDAAGSTLMQLERA